MDVIVCLTESKFDISDLRKCVGVFRNLAHLHSVALTHPFHSVKQNDIQTGPQKSLSLVKVCLCVLWITSFKLHILYFVACPDLTEISEKVH